MFKAVIANTFWKNTFAKFVQKPSCAITLGEPSTLSHGRKRITAATAILIFTPFYTAQAEDSGSLLRE